MYSRVKKNTNKAQPTITDNRGQVISNNGERKKKKKRREEKKKKKKKTKQKKNVISNNIPSRARVINEKQARTL